MTDAVSILIVEDDHVSAKVLKDMIDLFIRNGGEVFTETVRTAGDAEVKILSGDFNAILLDLNLTDSSGIETFGRIKHVAPSIPVKVLTGITDKEELECLRESLGAEDSLFIKPDALGAVTALREAVNHYVRLAFPA